MGEWRFDSVNDLSDRNMLLRLADLTELAEKWEKPCFSAFLNEHEQALAQQYRLTSLNHGGHFFWGGYENALRCVFCAVPQLCDMNSLNETDYPFKALTILFPKGYAVSHRDILGSLMALRIKREAVGDILVGDCLAVVFILDAALKLALAELTKIGSVGVRCILGAPKALPTAYKTIEGQGVVSTMRIDAVVAMLTNSSRAESVRMIEQALVQKNAQVVSSASKEVAEGDKLSVRGFGKFIISAIGSPTKKGRLHITYQKYI